jgi:tRNA(Ile)-lysidine synthase
MDKNNYKYYIDKSNYSLEYTRNRYRKEVLPFLKKENSLVHLKFLKFSEELAQVNQILNNYIEEILKNIKNEKGICISKLLELDPFLIKKIIEYELSLIYINDLFLISDKNTEEIIKLIKSNKSNGKVILPNNYIALKEYNYFKIVNNKNNSAYKYVMEDKIDIPTGHIVKVSESNDTSNYTIRLNSKEINLPIIVRSRKNGDKMAIKNLGGSKKVKDIFINEKIPTNLRDVLPVVVDSKNEILWLPGVKKSKFDVERDGIYDIILSYEEEKNEY